MVHEEQGRDLAPLGSENPPDLSARREVDTVTNLLSRLRRVPAAVGTQAGGHHRLAERVEALEAAVEENRRLNQRLADVVDVVTEILVPALDRDDERVKRALDDLNKTLGDESTSA